MIDNLVIILKHKKLVIISTILVFIISILISLTLTKWYKSSALIMPPSKEGFSFSLPLLNLPFSPGLGGDESIFKYLTIIKSRTIKEKIVNEFDLMDEYGETYYEKALKAFEENIDLDVTEEGAISLAIYAKTPIRARDMVVRYCELLDSTFTVLSVEQASNNRKFLETRVEDTQEKLKIAEEALRDFQVKYGVFAIPDQLISGVKFIAEIESKALGLEIQLNYLKKFIKADSPKYQQLKQELAEYRKTINQLKYGENNKSIVSILPPLSKVPEISLGYFRKYRNVEIYNKLLEFVLPQYENARIEEAKKIPRVQILDYPTLPELKAKPKRAFFVLGVTFIYLVILVTYLLTIERLKQLAVNNPELHDKIQFVLSSLSFSKKQSNIRSS